MSNVQAFATYLLDALAQLMMTEPLIWINSIVLLAIAFKIFVRITKL